MKIFFAGFQNQLVFIQLTNEVYRVYQVASASIYTIEQQLVYRNLTEVSVQYAVHVFYVDVCTTPKKSANFLI